MYLASRFMSRPLRCLEGFFWALALSAGLCYSVAAIAGNQQYLQGFVYNDLGFLRSAARTFPLSFELRRGAADWGILYGQLDGEDIGAALRHDPHSADLWLHWARVLNVPGREQDLSIALARANALVPIDRWKGIRRLSEEEQPGRDHGESE